MHISLGDRVRGHGDSLGTIERFIVDPQSQLVCSLVIRPGLLANERMVPLECCVDDEAAHDDGDVRLDLDRDRLNEAPEYTEAAYHAPPMHSGAPPAADYVGQSRAEYQLDEAQAMNIVTGMGGRPLGSYPGGEQTVSDDAQLAVLDQGTAIFDVNAEEIGNVDGCTVDAYTGQIVELTMGGGLFSGADPVPTTLIDRIGQQGVLLKVPRQQIDQLKAS
jgi:hypothetical protein